MTLLIRVGPHRRIFGHSGEEIQGQPFPPQADPWPTLPGRHPGRRERQLGQAAFGMKKSKIAGPESVH